jgi:hypothetical protein
MMKPCSSRRGPNENSREDGRDCQSQFHEQVNAYNKCIPGSMYKKSALYTPGNAGKSGKLEYSDFDRGMVVWLVHLSGRLVSLDHEIAALVGGDLT